VSWPIQDHCDAFLTALAAAPGGPPSLKVFDGSVTEDGLFGGGVFDADPPYALVYFAVETPDGLVAPDAVSLTMLSGPIDSVAIVHNVGASPQAARAARAVAGRVRAALLDVTLTISGRSCFPIRWREGQPPQRNEEVPGSTTSDVVDVYGWRSVPG
jgi:hypothetical protein